MEGATALSTSSETTLSPKGGEHPPSLVVDFHLLLPFGHAITSVETGAVQSAY